MDKVQQVIHEVYRKHFGKMMAALLCVSRDLDFEVAEDIVHDAFSAALNSWKNDAIPSNPAGWIYRVSRNKALNELKKNKRTWERGVGSEDSEIMLQESFFHDPQLRLLFLCANSGLSPKVQVVITLKYVVNFKVESIARVLGMTLDGVDKLLLRARQKIRLEKFLWKEPGEQALRQRLPVVHKIIYLIFNEGYKASWGKQLLREELCEEALLLNKTLLESEIADEQTQALQALMFFNAARFKARFGRSGELLDLEEHDRKLWNQDLIRLGTDFLKKAGGGDISNYHLEASIAYMHCVARDFASTDWKVINDLYERLFLLDPNPFVELNWAIAMYYAGQKVRALEILHALERNPFLNQYYLLNATLGKIYMFEGNFETAKQYFEKTIKQTAFEVERAYIRRIVRKLG